MNMKFGSLLTVSGLLAAGGASAVVLKVPQQFPTIQAAVNAAAAGDTVRVAPGVYQEHVLIQGRAVNLVGTGPAEVTLDGGDNGRALTVADTGTAPMLVSGFTIRNGRVSFEVLNILGAGQGGGLYAQGANITIRNNVLTANRGCLGIALATLESTVALVRNRIEDNIAEPRCGQQAAIIRAGVGESTITGNVFQNHQASGLQLQGAGKVTVSNNIFRNNIAISEFEPNAEYGGLQSLYTDITLTNNLFSGNSAYGVGGAYISEFEGGVVRISGNSFVGNKSVVGATALELAALAANSYIFQQNRFDESAEQPILNCSWPMTIDVSNVFASYSAISLAGACVPAP